MPDVEGWMTLGDYAEIKATMLIVCTRCYHGSEVPAKEAVKRWGADTLDREIEARATCKQIVSGRECGGGARVSWSFPLTGPTEANPDPFNFSTPGKER